MEGDVIGVYLTVNEERQCKMSFSLNGSFAAPFGSAFEAELPEDATLSLIVAAGDDGQLTVNLGQRLFQAPPPAMKEGEPLARGLGESMQLLPAWKVKLPKGVKAWPVFEESSRDSKGKKPLEDDTCVEELRAAEGNWIELMQGWVQTKMTIAGRDIEALKSLPLWSPVDPPRKTAKAKHSKQKVNATFDVDFCEKHFWNFEDNNMLAKCENGPSMLSSAESARSGILQWMLKCEDGSEAFEVGVIPAHEVENGSYLHDTGKCGLKSNNTEGGDQKSSWPMYQKFIEVICDIEKNKVTFKVGEKKDQLQEVKIMDLPYNDEVKLAVTGWNDTRFRLEPPDKKKAADEDSDSDSDMDMDSVEAFATTCGNSVQGNTWHVATLAVDLEQRREIILYLDGEPHLHARDPELFAPDGPFSIDPVEGVVLFGRRRAGKIAEKAWRQGGHLRQMRIDSRALDVQDIWSLHLPKGVWGCRTCSCRNPAEARVCWQCHTAKQKSAARPPNDADPRHDGLMILVADSFRELVLESKEHVLVCVHAPWCEACQKVKPHFYRLAKMLKGADSIRVAMLDSDENDINNRFFPEPFIPNIKLFMAGKKGSPLTCNTEKTFEAYVKFLEEHAGVTLAEAVEDYYPTYCVAKEVTELVEEIRAAAMAQNLRLTEMRTMPHAAVANFCYCYLMDSEFYRSGNATQAASLMEGPTFGTVLPSPTGPSFGALLPSPTGASGGMLARTMPSLGRSASTPADGAVPPPPQGMVRQRSGGGPTPGLPPLTRAHSTQPPGAPIPLSRQSSRQSSAAPPGPLPLMRVVSTPMEQIEDPSKLEEELKRSHLARLLDVDVPAELKKTLPENPRDFLRGFFLKEAAPKFNHQTFYNARTGFCWKKAPLARRLVAATRILRAMLKWARREQGRRYGKHADKRGVQQWAEARVASMSAAALRSNWRRVEEAICRKEGREHGVHSLQVLLERGFDPSAMPFGISPLLLASLAGNLEAAQFLFVRGANVHVIGGVHKDQQLTPIDAAASCGFLRIVALLAENGACTARALHYAACGGHEEVCAYLLRKGCSPDLRADHGLSAFTVAVLCGQVAICKKFLPYCSPGMLEEGLSMDLCGYVGIPGGSSILHLIAHMGGLREVLIKPLVDKCPVLLNRANWAQEIPAFTAPAIMRTALQPKALAAFEGLAAAPDDLSPAELKALAMREVLAETPVTDEECKGEVCIVCMCEASEDDPLVRLKGCGHFFHRGGCLGRWRAEGTNGASCPACRAPLPEPAARAEARGPTLLEVAAYANDTDSVDKLLGAGATQELKEKGSAITPLMWAHWRDSKDAVAALTARGAQLSNGDLEGLQRLRDMRRRNSPAEATAGTADAKDASGPAAATTSLGATAGPSGAQGGRGAAAAQPEKMVAEKEDTEKPDPGVLELMDVSVDLLWRQLGRGTHHDAITQLGLRMAHGALPLSITGHEAPRQKVKEVTPLVSEFLAAARVAMGEDPAAASRVAAALEAAKFFAVRSLAEGHATSLPSAIALRLYLGSADVEGLHGRVARGFEAMYSSAPLSAEMERIVPFLTQLEVALEGLPSHRGTQFVGLNVQTPSGKLQEALNGERGIGSFYPGGLVLWRGCASVTLDPMLAKERATSGPGCALVLKIRSNSSRDVSPFSPAPDLSERLFLPRRRFRVAGVYPLEDQILRRGLAMSGGVHTLVESFESPDLSALSGGAALQWDAACSRRAACVILDEEDTPPGGSMQP